LGKNTENEVSQSIFADGKRKVKGKEEFLPSCAKHTACTEYEELLEMMIETLVQKRIIIRFNFRATDRLLRNWGGMCRHHFLTRVKEGDAVKERLPIWKKPKHAQDRGRPMELQLIGQKNIP